ncbi:MAG: pyridoxamine 5'-phosphate oxidase family protein [Acidimicrobiales bacterium]
MTDGDTTSDDPTSDDGATTGDDYVDSYEDVSMFVLSDEREQTLLDTQTECVFMWTTDAGDPVGVYMNFVEHDGSIWLTCTRRRKRVRALEKRPRGSVAVSSRGTDIGISQAVTFKGDVVIHDDPDTLAWMYRALAEKVRPGDVAKQDAFVHHLDSPGRVVLELRPDTRIGFDSEAMFANSPAGPSTTRV